MGEGSKMGQEKSSACDRGPTSVKGKRGESRSGQGSLTSAQKLWWL